MELNKLSIQEAHDKLVAGEISAVDLAQAHLDAIAEKNSDINAYVTVFDDVIAQANAAQKKIDAGEATMLTGIPLSIKDLLCMEGRRSTGGSKILEHYVAPYTATAVAKLNAHTPVYLGKTNTDEFGQGGSTENSAYGITKNPHDTTRVAGGSSGGAAASIAGGMAIAGLGSDTGGSIRQPASFCGLVGLKPTYGAVSRYGLMAMASSFDTVCPIGKNVSDVEILFNAIKGVDVMDSTTVEGKASETVHGGTEVKVIGVPRQFLKEGIDPDVLASYEDGLRKLQEAGYELKDVEIPNIEHALSVYYILVPAEISANMSRFDGVKYGSQVPGVDLGDTYAKTRGELLGKEVKRRIMLGTYVLSAGYADQYYRKAWHVRNMIRASFADVFKTVDVIAMPVSPTPAFVIGAHATDPLQMYLMDIFTVAANVVGVPAMSVPGKPITRDDVSLPVGFQLIAPHLCEARLFEVGKKFEKIV
jgi:aspartyl-tRNA(Asn)/glutamyl-tRNA(Gln) amidotransferase subunit A